MPSYVYRCTNDNCPSAAAFEMRHSMTETCDGDYCASENEETGEGCQGFLKRVYTPIALSFRGDGWGKDMIREACGR